MVAEDVPPNELVTVFGRVSDDELASLYRRAWIFCLPSTYGGRHPYIEAMASGCPVVATPNPGAIEIAEGGRYALLTTDGELGKSLLGLLRSPAERDRLAAAGLSRAGEHDLASIAVRYEAVHERVLSRVDPHAMRVRALRTTTEASSPRAAPSCRACGSSDLRDGGQGND